jgi:DNA-binding GntR family transcriptional regulator
MSKVAVKAKVDLEEVWDQIDDKAFVEELHARAGNSLITDAIDALAECDCDDDPYPDEYTEPLFQRMGEWDRDELMKAIREDDGRRCVDLLKRHSGI